MTEWFQALDPANQIVLKTLPVAFVGGLVWIFFLLTLYHGHPVFWKWFDEDD